MSLARIATNTGINPIDLCFTRTFFNLLIACGTVTYNKKHIIKDVPKEVRFLIFCRSVMGLIGFTCLLISCIYLPIFVVAIIFNLAPFLTAILGWFINNEPVTKFIQACMIGCFSGVIILTIAKNHE